MTAYSDFIEKNGIKSGIILANKGFSQSLAAKCFERNPDLHYLNPVRRNSTLARTHDMYSYEGILKGHPEITYRKSKVDGKERWEIETVMRYYKQSCEFDKTMVHDDYSVYATEFINFLSSLLTYRLLNRFEDTGLLEEYTYGEIMQRIRCAKKVRTEEKEGFALVRLNPSTMNVLERLGLVSASPTPQKRKRGRPKKSGI